VGTVTDYHVEFDGAEEAFSSFEQAIVHNARITPASSRARSQVIAANTHFPLGTD